eukprot:125223-Amphidinium_carterae.1
MLRRYDGALVSNLADSLRNEYCSHAQGPRSSCVRLLSIRFLRDQAALLSWRVVQSQEACHTVQRIGRDYF